jgi:hypothetical protein
VLCNKVIARQGRALTDEKEVEKPRDNLIVRLWSHDKLIAWFSSKCDLIEWMNMRTSGLHVCANTVVPIL